MTHLSSMNDRQAAEMIATAANLAVTQAPLADGFRAAASEASGKMASGFRRLAEAIDRGESLERVISDPQLRLPVHMRGMVAAAARTGQLGPALDQLLEHKRQSRALFWRIWSSLAYPIFILLFNFAVIGFLLCWIVPVFKTMFQDFGLRLPMMTQAIVAISDLAVWLLIGPGFAGFVVAGIGACVLVFLAVTGRGGATVQRLIIESMPIVGVLWQWSDAAGFTYLLGSLLEKQVPLAEALHLSADGMKKVHVRHAGHWMAREVEAGRSLAELVETSGALPVSSAPLLRWGERSNSLPEALKLLSEMFLERAQMRADWLRSVSPPLVYVIIGVSAAAVIIGLFMPLVTLIQGLT